MWLKLLRASAQIVFVILAIVLLIGMFKTQTNQLAVDNLRKEMLALVADSNRKQEEKTERLQKDLNAYQASRESRAKFFAEKVDKLEKRGVTPDVMDRKEITSVLDNHLQYLEGKTNKVESGLSDLDSRLTSKIDILENRIKILEEENTALKRESKNIIHNANNFTVVNGKKEL